MLCRIWVVSRGEKPCVCSVQGDSLSSYLLDRAHWPGTCYVDHTAFFLLVVLQDSDSLCIPGCTETLCRPGWLQTRRESVSASLVLGLMLDYLEIFLLSNLLNSWICHLVNRKLIVGEKRAFLICHKELKNKIELYSLNAIYSELNHLHDCLNWVKIKEPERINWIHLHTSYPVVVLLEGYSLKVLLTFSQAVNFGIGFALHLGLLFPLLWEVT